MKYVAALRFFDIQQLNYMPDLLRNASFMLSIDWDLTLQTGNATGMQFAFYFIPCKLPASESCQKKVVHIILIFYVTI